MRELALNILDIAENSLSAGAKLIRILLDIHFSADRFSVCIEDDGCGMDAEMLARVTDPFTTHPHDAQGGHGAAAVQIFGGERGGPL